MQCFSFGLVLGFIGLALGPWCSGDLSWQYIGTIQYVIQLYSFSYPYTVYFSCFIFLCFVAPPSSSQEFLLANCSGNHLWCWRFEPALQLTKPRSKSLTSYTLNLCPYVVYDINKFNKFGVKVIAE